MRTLSLMISLFAVSVLTLSGCYSRDLGNEPADKVPVKLGLADWDNAGAVIGAKCATCHTADRKPFVPANTPRHLDRMNEREFYTNQRNRKLIHSMLDSIEGEDGDKVRDDRGRTALVEHGGEAEHEEGGDHHVIMPPKFATPLYPDEKSVLVQFLKGSLKNLESPAPPPASGGGGDPAGNPAPLKFSDVESIVLNNCATGGCHDGASGIRPLKTRQDFLNMKSRPLKAIQRGSMPADNPDFKDTEDGKKLIAYLMGPQSE